MKRKINLLEAIPSPRVEIQTENKADGSVVLLLPRFQYKWMNIFLFGNRSPFIRVELEEYGSLVWKMIDGKRSVRKIIAELDNSLNECENYEERVATYISQLHRDKLIHLYYS